MSAWTLRQQRMYDHHGNGPQNHSAARRAVRHVRRHANETGPLDMAVPPAPVTGYQLGELFGGFRAALAGIAAVESGVMPRKDCGATTVFYHEREHIEAICVLPAGHEPADQHSDAVMGTWSE